MFYYCGEENTNKKIFREEKEKNGIYKKNYK